MLFSPSFNDGEERKESKYIEETKHETDDPVESREIYIKNPATGLEEASPVPTMRDNFSSSDPNIHFSLQENSHEERSG
jgi:hypothetical protein